MEENSEENRATLSNISRDIIPPVAVPLFERIPYDIMLLSYDSYDSQRPIEGLESPG